MENSWTMNIKQNVMSHTRITHDYFRTNKIQNGQPFKKKSHYLGNMA